MLNLTSLSRKEKEELYLAYRVREIRQAKQQTQTQTNLRQFDFRGNNSAIQKFIDAPRPAEWILEGASETGKTFASLNLLDAIARKYKNARGAIVRKWHIDLASTVLDIYKREFLDYSQDVEIFGGESPIFYDYPSGTRIWTAGIDRPGKVLSGALDFVYVNQVEELDAQDWETLSTRTTGRAGVIVPGILFGDMNPTGLAHWIYSRESSGTLKVFPTTHRDNPSLFDAQNNPTSQGNATLDRLSRLTGARRARLYEGKRASAEGLVYSEVWDENDGSVTELADYVADGGQIFWAADDGYSAGSASNTAGRDPQTGYYVADSHPRVFLLCQFKSDGHLDVFAESYACLKLTDEHLAEVKAFSYPSPQFVSHGPGSAEFRGRIQAARLQPYQCTEQVETSISELRSWLAKDKNNFRRVRVHPRCKQLRAEFLSYVCDSQTQKPVKQFDHGMDALRYLVWNLRGTRR